MVEFNANNRVFELFNNLHPDDVVLVEDAIDPVKSRLIRKRRLMEMNRVAKSRKRFLRRNNQ